MGGHIFDDSDSEDELATHTKDGEQSKSLYCRSSELETVNLEDF